MNGLTIALCCYNSADRLQPTLTHIAYQQVDQGLQLEILIINNASTDNTATRAVALWTALHSKFSFRIIDELRPGLSHARQRAIQEAANELILFCDDDNWLAPDYVQQAYSLMMEDAAIGVLGGCGFEVPEVDVPAWFKKYKSSYALGPQAVKEGYMGDENNIYGACMVLRRSVLMKLFELGFESLLTGRKGESLTSGEDIEMCIWHRMVGYKIYYSEALTFKHFIPKSRLTESYFLKRSYEKGKTEAVFMIYRAHLRNHATPWLANMSIWYWEIMKRLVHYALSFLKFNSFDARVKRNILASSIRFRLQNFKYLREVNQRIKSLKATCAAHG